MGRKRVFARDRYRCVYCGQVFPADELTVDHLQPRVRGGDRSHGNLVTACRGCNTLKGHRRLAAFLADNAEARRNFFRYATAAWPRHLRAVEEEMERGRRTILGEQTRSERARDQRTRGQSAHSPIARRRSRQ